RQLEEQPEGSGPFVGACRLNLNRPHVRLLAVGLRLLPYNTSTGRIRHGAPARRGGAAATRKDESMFQGELLAIFMTGRKRSELQAVTQVDAVAGRGLAGDRFFRQEGLGNPGQEVTLVESEALEALARDCQITLAPHQTRRNLLTRNVPLNHLVGRDF